MSGSATTVIRRVDRYELLEQVGSGGMAVVYRGRDTALEREVAVKLLHPHLAARPESRARFSREARAVARLSHPNIVEIYDYAGDAAVESYLVTEFVHGRTLRAFAEAEGIAYPEIAALLARALADALVHAHAAGVIHRDLKPENVLLVEAGGRPAVKLVDFGIARILASEERMTMTGALVGSPYHMAPEIIEGREADARSDVFSLGTILYWLATGAMPFAGPNPTATLRRVIEGEYEDPRAVAPRVSDRLTAVIARALAAAPEDRTPTAAALRDDLDAALADAGLADPEAELAAFLAGPRAYQSALGPRLVAHALAGADAALAAGETARALRLLDRVLALDPESREAPARLARAGRRLRRRRLAQAGAAVAVVLAAWFGGQVAFRAWRRAAEAPPAPGAAEAAAGARPSAVAPAGAEGQRTAPGRAARRDAPPRDGSPARGGGAPRGGEPSSSAVATSTGGPDEDAATTGSRPYLPLPPARDAEAARAGRGRVAAQGAPAVVAVHVRPYAQRAILDGVEVAQGEQRVTFSLAPGLPHRIEIEHACCFPFVREFAADEPVPQPLELKAPLRPRPARLRVEAEPASRVYVDGRMVGTAGDSQRAPLEVPLSAGGDSPYEARAELRLERDGAPPVRASLKLRAGTDVTFAAPTRGASEPPSALAPTQPAPEASP